MGGKKEDNKLKKVSERGKHCVEPRYNPLLDGCEIATEYLGKKSKCEQCPFVKCIEDMGIAERHNFVLKLAEEKAVNKRANKHSQNS